MFLCEVITLISLAGTPLLLALLNATYAGNCSMSIQRYFLHSFLWKEFLSMDYHSFYSANLGRSFVLFPLFFNCK